jgi:hypothetical protein
MPSRPVSLSFTKGICHGLFLGDGYTVFAARLQLAQMTSDMNTGVAVLDVVHMSSDDGVIGLHMTVDN